MTSDPCPHGEASLRLAPGGYARKCNRCGANWPLAQVETEPGTEEVPSQSSMHDSGVKESPPSSYSLVCRCEGRELSLTLAMGETLALGRGMGPIANICTDNISERHADIWVTDHGLFIEDVGTDGRGSTNGTYVDDTKIIPRQPVSIEPQSTIHLATDPPLHIEIRPAGDSA